MYVIFLYIKEFYVIFLTIQELLVFEDIIVHTSKVLIGQIKQSIHLCLIVVFVFGENYRNKIRLWIFWAIKAANSPRVTFTFPLTVVIYVYLMVKLRFCCSLSEMFIWTVFINYHTRTKLSNNKTNVHGNLTPHSNRSPQHTVSWTFYELFHRNNQELRNATYLFKSVVSFLWKNMAEMRL